MIPTLPACLTLSTRAKWFDPTDETHHFKLTLHNAENKRSMDFDYSGGCLAFAPGPEHPAAAHASLARKAISQGKRTLHLEAQYKNALAVLHQHAQPELAGCLHSLLMDAQAGSQTFPDFCGECGYDEDSRKAFSVWQACQTVAADLARVIPEPMRAQLSEALQDY